MKFRPVSGKAVRHPNRTRRQEEAKKRQEERNKRTPEQQLKLITKRPGKSKKEVARLKKPVGSPSPKS
jgi:hypothetical protein